MERWKEVVNSNGVYFISDSGKIKTKNGNVIKTQITNSGYELAHIRINKKRYAKTIHRLVAVHFCNPPCDFECMQVNHKDCNKLNNHYENLEWVTKEQNSRHAWENGRHHKTRESARERMRIMGKKNEAEAEKRLRKYYENNKDFYINNCRELAKSQRKPIKGVNDKGGVIYFESINDAKRSGYENVSGAMKRNGKCMGYRFTFQSESR